MKRVLYLTPSWPRGPSFGGQLRALQIGRALKQVGEVTLCVVSADAGDAAAMRASAEEFELLPPILPEDAPNRGPVQKLRWALDPRYLNLHGSLAPEADRRRILEALPRYDLVWLLAARTPNVLRLWRCAHAHLDVDNLPSAYVPPAGGTRERLLRALLRRRERGYRRRFTTVSVCSDDDRALLGGGENVHVIPNGFERPAAEPVRMPSADAPRIGFIGLCTYGPNLEGVRWFLDACWPTIRREVPGVRFRLAGQGTDGPLVPAATDVDALGWIADPAAEIATWSALVVPVRSGAGTRIKLADAFSRRCPVVSTTLGAYGYGVRDGEQLRLADHAGTFAAACVELIRQPGQAAAMAARAWAEFLEKWTWEAIAPRIRAAAEDCLRRSAATR